MASEPNPTAPEQPEGPANVPPGLPWDHVAAELRAYREEQRRAWGDVDNTTLGRYLAGEINPEERQAVEQALDHLPELRKLTDLVRDVLDSCEPAATSPPLVLLSAPPPALPRRRSRLLHYTSLALAASVLLALAAALPNTKLLTQVFEVPSSGRQVALLAEKVDLLHGPSTARAPSTDRDSGIPDVSKDVHRADEASDRRAKAGSGESSFPRPMALPPSNVSAKKESIPEVVALTSSAEELQKRGDLNEAATRYRKAHELCMRKLGPSHPETRRSLNNLAQVYEVALNGAPAVSATVSSSQPTAGAGIASFVDRSSQAPVHRSLMARRPLHDDLLEQKPQELQTSVVPVLVESLRTARTSADRERLALALGRLGPAARDAVPVLVNTLRSRARQAPERSAILQALGEIGSNTQEALPALVSSLRNDEPRARQSAAQALVQMGPAARGAVADLIQPGLASDPLGRDVLRHIRGREGRIGICDECGCFSVATLATCREAIRNLAQQKDVEVLVETIRSLSSAAPREEDSSKFSPRGIHVLVGKDDRTVRVRVATSLQQQGLLPNRVARAFAPSLRSEDYDTSLRAGIAYISSILAPQPRPR